MRTTTSGRAFTKDMFDLFSTLMISLRIENHKIRFRSYPNSFTAEEAIANLGGLQFIKSNRDADPNDPTRIITHVVTTHFSLSRDMAKNLCQTFMDACLFESATDQAKREFQNRGLCQVTPKGAHLLAKFVHRNKLPLEESRHITANATANLVYLERAEDEDAILLTQDSVEAIFKRFAGPEPNVGRIDSPGDSPLMSSNSGGRDRTLSAADLCNGIEVKDQQHNYDIYKHTFYGKSAVEWLLDYSTVISKEEAICICQEMVTAGYIEQVGEENRTGPSLFKTGNAALYHLTESGRTLAGWRSLEDCSINNDWMDERSTVGAKGDRSNPEVNLLSAQFKLTSSNVSRLPITIDRAQRRSMDESSLANFQYNDDSSRGATRRLSQILSDPAFQITLSEAGAMSSYAPSSSGRESVGASAGGTRLSPPLTSSQSTTSNTSRLYGILSDSTVRDLFKSFLKQNICEENLSFYLEVIEYKSKFSTLISSVRAYNQSVLGQEQSSGNQPYPPSLRELEKQICTQAFAIYETYLVSGAPREVNLPHQMRQDITAYMQAVVRNMETNDVTPSNNAPANKNLPPTPSSPSSSSQDSTESEKANSSGSQRELIHIALFDVIHDHIFRLMSTDSVPKFIKTEKYLEVVMSKHKRNHAAAAASNTIVGASVGQESEGGTPANSVSNGYDAGSGNGDGRPAGSGGDGGSLPTSVSSRNEDLSSLRRSFSLNDHHRQQDHASPGHAGTSNNASRGIIDDGSMEGGSDGGVAINSRSRSVGPGLSSRPISGASLPQSSNAGLQQLRTPRARSASSNVAVEGGRSAQYSQQEYMGSAVSGGGKPRTNGGNSSSGGGSSNAYGRSNGGGALATSNAAASLMDIYAQQQGMQQYSNQRAQLSHAQVQQMYILRQNSRSVPSLPLPSAIPTSSSSSSTTPRVPTHYLSDHPVPAVPIRTDSQSAGDFKKTPEEQVTVLFESTSFAIQDPNTILQQQQPRQQSLQPVDLPSPLLMSPTQPVTSSSVKARSPESKVSPTHLLAVAGSLPGSYPKVNGRMHMDPASSTVPGPALQRGAIQLKEI